MRMMGITSDDVANPDTKPGPSRKPRAAGGPIKSFYASPLQGGAKSSTTPGSAAEALTDARREAARLAQQDGWRSEGMSGSGYGDYSDSQSLKIPMRRQGAPPTTNTAPSTALHHATKATTASSPSFSTAAGTSFPPPPLRGPQTRETGAVQLAERMKVEGNNAFERGDFRQSIDAYSKAIDALESAQQAESSLRGAGVSGKALEYHLGALGTAEKHLLAALYSNRSAAYLQGCKSLDSTESAYAHALCDADQAVGLRPDWFKGYSRQGDVYFKIQKYHQASESYAMALTLDKQNQRLSNSLTEAKERAKLANRDELKVRRARRRGTDDGGSDAAAFRHTTGGMSNESPLASAGGAPFKASATLNGGNAKQKWEYLKTEMEQTNQAPTGEGYRQAQLEKYRRQHQNGSAGMSSHDSTFAGTQSSSNESSSLPPIGRSSMGSVTSEGRGDSAGTDYSPAAAAAYQQKLLDSFRRKRGVA